MGITSTLYRFLVEFADIDRGVYETLDVRAAQHPSEDDERLIVRVLARIIAHEDGLEFGRGLSTPEDAGLWSRTLTGEIGTWIDVGLPSAERLHRASKGAERVLVFTHKPGSALRKEWRSRRIHKADTIQIYRLPVHLVERLAQSISRKTQWHVTVMDGQVSILVGGSTLEGVVETVALDALLLQPDESKE